MNLSTRCLEVLKRIYKSTLSHKIHTSSNWGGGGEVKRSQDKHPNIEANKLLKIASVRQINIYWSFSCIDFFFCLKIGLNYKFLCNTFCHFYSDWTGPHKGKTSSIPECLHGQVSKHYYACRWTVHIIYFCLLQTTYLRDFERFLWRYLLLSTSYASLVLPNPSKSYLWTLGLHLRWVSKSVQVYLLWWVIIYPKTIFQLFWKKEINF